MFVIFATNTNPMRQKSSIFIVITLLIATLSSCRNNTGNVTNANTTASIPIGRVDQFIYHYNIGDSIPGNLSEGLELYIKLMGYDTQVTDSILSALSNSPVSQVFGRDIEGQFTDYNKVSEALGYLNERSMAEIGRPLIGQVFTIASPYRQSIVIADSIVLVALNHYLGADYEGYSMLPDYQRTFKTPRYIPRDIAQALIRTTYPYRPGEGTLLERMIYEGFVAESVKRLTDSDEATAIGVTQTEYNTAQVQLENVWKDLASSKLLYSTNESDIDRMVSQAPFVTIGSKRYVSLIGAYVGHEIIKSYLKENPGMTVPQLYKQIISTSPQQLLINARFNP